MNTKKQIEEGIKSLEWLKFNIVGTEEPKKNTFEYAAKVYLENAIELLKDSIKYTDIEEQLGIELKIILKVIMTMKVWAIKNGRIRRFYVTDIVSYKKILKGYITFGDTHNGWSTEEEIKFENYGKTWALTKEELL